MQLLPGDKTSTSINYTIDNALGNIGIIAAYSRTFCGTCNRVRITSTGGLRTCLYSHDELDLKKLIRSGANDKKLMAHIRNAIYDKPKDGFAAEKSRPSSLPVGESMSTIGG